MRWEEEPPPDEYVSGNTNEALNLPLASVRGYESMSVPTPFART
jgi:hypothetical protein